MSGGIGGILAEVADEEGEVAREAGEIVVELRIGEKFAGGAGVVVKSGRGTSVAVDVTAAMLMEHYIIGGRGGSKRGGYEEATGLVYGGCCGCD